MNVQRCKAWRYPGHESWDGELVTLPDGRQCAREAGHQGAHSLIATDPNPKALAAYIVQWIRQRNGAELDPAFCAMRVDDFELLVGELELILEHGGKPPTWVR